MSKMKGKGKGKDQTPCKECPLKFPDFPPTDASIRNLTRYSSILQRKDEDSVSLEGIECLQMELESVLVSVSKRRDVLDDELQGLMLWQQNKKGGEKQELEGNGKKGYQSEGKLNKKQKEPSSKPVASVGRPSKSKNSPKPEVTAKKSSTPDVKPNKKHKDNSGKAHAVTTIGRPKSKNNQKGKEEVVEPIPEPPKKNESASRFWSFVEPYCADITQDDIKMLEDWIRDHDDDDEYQKIPPLGKHYTYQWTEDDLNEELIEGSKSVEKRKGLSNSNSSFNAMDGQTLLRKAANEFFLPPSKPEETPILGRLTQRLMSCLIEQNLMTSLEDTMGDACKESPDIDMVVAPIKPSFMKSLNLGQTTQLEKRLLEELVDIGIFESEDSFNDDELLTELKKLQETLKTVSSYNLNEKKRLLKLAKEEVARQEIKKKLEAVDAEVMEAQRRIATAKKNKTSITKDEREQAYKALCERESLLKQLQNVES